jgi:hypothetical protein
VSPRPLALLRHPRAHTLLALAAVAGVGLGFWLGALGRTRGHAPVPLDDVYIHFAFARAAAEGHPFQWIAGQGYSSGGTSLTWPLLLAPFHALGLRGERLFVAAAALSLVCLLDLARSLRALVGDAPWPVVLATALGPVAVPLAAWTLYSGMEVALLSALSARLVLAVRRLGSLEAGRRAAAQRALGLLAALVVATRPEALALAVPAALAGAARARTTSAPRSLARMLGPTLALLVALALVNQRLTGEAQAAGAVRKLLLSDPYATTTKTAVEITKNFVVLESQGVELALGGRPFAALVVGLGLYAALSRRSRGLALPALSGALGVLALSTLNATARFQNLRYVAPVLTLLVLAALLGAAELARRGRAHAALASALAALVVLAPARLYPTQLALYAEASRNIAEQQVEVAARVRALAPRRVMVNDAGAIPYLSGARALDGLGLGGLYGLPFARASVHGEGAVLELIERLPPDERPDLLALYPGWWPGLTSSFGEPLDEVRITGNVICGADTKVLYRPDWSALGGATEPAPLDDAEVLDELDVADLVSERAHGYEMAKGKAGGGSGFVTFAVHERRERPSRAGDGRARVFDGGREHAARGDGAVERFRVRGRFEKGPVTVVLRTDGPAESVSIGVEKPDGRLWDTALVEDSWPSRRGFRTVLARHRSLEPGDRLVVFAPSGLRSFHYWVVRAR